MALVGVRPVPCFLAPLRSLYICTACCHPPNLSASLRRACCLLSALCPCPDCCSSQRGRRTGACAPRCCWFTEYFCLFAGQSCDIIQFWPTNKYIYIVRPLLSIWQHSTFCVKVRSRKYSTADTNARLDYRLESFENCVRVLKNVAIFHGWSWRGGGQGGGEGG